MARIRTIKPEFFTSEDIVNLSPMARLLYVALWCEADREGRLVWKPRTFKIRYFPSDSCNIDKLVEELRDSGLVMVYIVNDINYAFIPTFHAHQHINPREAKSLLPEPPSNVYSTRAPRVTDASSPVSDAQVGRERKGKEGITSSPPTGVANNVWIDFLKHRKAKKAPVTDTVIEGIKREALKAGWTLDSALQEICARGWTGFNADWVGSQSPVGKSGVLAGAI